jgi:cell division protein FtsA
MSKKKIISAIDAGTTKVCALIAEVDENGKLRVAGIGCVPSRGMHKGMITDIDEAKESIRSAIKSAEQSSGYRIDSAYVGVTGHHITGHINKGIVALTRSDHLVRPDDLRRVLQVGQSIKVASDQKILHLIPRQYMIDGQDGVLNPVGMHGFQLDAETYIITAGVAAVQDLVKCIRGVGVGVDVEDLVFNGLASAEACLTEDDKQMGTILADIGGGVTNISIFKDGSVWHTAVIPVAGYQLTKDISIGLGLPFDVAEEMKKKYGTVIPRNDENADNDAIAQNGHNISYKGLRDIIIARMDELLRLIALELPNDEQKAIAPGGLVLTGGSSNLVGIDEFGKEILKMPVRIGTPQNVCGDDRLNAPAFATALGLLLWGMKPSVKSGQK